MSDEKPKNPTLIVDANRSGGRTLSDVATNIQNWFSKNGATDVGTRTLDILSIIYVDNAPAELTEAFKEAVGSGEIAGASGVQENTLMSGVRLIKRPSGGYGPR